MCSGCYTPFDKKNREDHMTWKVTVHEVTEDVSLVCPACQENNRGKNA